MKLFILVFFMYICLALSMEEGGGESYFVKDCTPLQAVSAGSIDISNHGKLIDIPITKHNKELRDPYGCVTIEEGDVSDEDEEAVNKPCVSFLYKIFCCCRRLE